MNFNIKSVLIVGGGSSGWFTASALCRLCPNIDVTLIESKNVPTIGVFYGKEILYVLWTGLIKNI